MAIVAGAFCGQWFEYNMFVNTGRMNSSAWLWYRSTPFKIIIRILFTMMCFFFISLPAAMLASGEKQVSEEQYLLRAFTAQLLSEIVPNFLHSFAAFGLLRYASYRFGLDNQEVRGQEFNTRAEYLKSIGLELADATSEHSGPAGRRGNRRVGNKRHSSFSENTIEMETI